MKRLYASMLLPSLCSIFAAYVFSCATIKNVITESPDASVTSSIIADCVKPEIADQVSNILSGINAIVLEPSKLDDVKASEITMLKSAGEEALACALREGIGDITSMIRNASSKHAAIDPRVVKAQDLMARVIHEQHFTYKDGWSSSSL